MKLRGSARLSATYGPTGRFITADSDYALAREWAELASAELLQSHRAHERFLSCLAQPNHATLDGEILLFRGQRRFGESYAPSSHDMGPPPAVVAREGRYNKDHESVLYLSESEVAVLEEPIAGDGPLWIQRFVVRTDQLLIADFSSLRTDDFVSKVFWFAELAGNSDVAVRILFSQLVASLVAQQFDGMRVPGVRGSKDLHYSNVVIFRAESRWRSWLDADCPPYAIAK